MTEATTTADVERDLLTSLRTIATHWAALLVPTGSGGTGVKSSDPITATDERVSLRHEVTLALNGWARVIIEDRDLTTDSRSAPTPSG